MPSANKYRPTEHDETRRKRLNRASDYMHKVGFQLRYERQSRRLTQEELAVKSGVAQCTISKIELGQTYEFGTLYMLCIALKMLPGTLLKRAEKIYV